MTREEEAIKELEILKEYYWGYDDHGHEINRYGKTVLSLDMAIKSLKFTEWVAKELFSDEWEYNKDSFEEIACRKLAKLGFVKEVDGEWVLVESEDKE